MNLQPLPLVPSCFAILTLPLLAQQPPETEISPLIESVGMFKNGVAVVRATFKADAAGMYRWNKVPQVVHGTFWVESDAKVTVQSTARTVEEKDEREQPSGNLQADLAGKDVTLTLRNPATPETTTVTGKVWTLPPPIVKRSWDTNYSSLLGGAGYYGWRWHSPSHEQPVIQGTSTGNYLVLDQGGADRVYIGLDSIVSARVVGPFEGKSRQVERPVLLFQTDAAATVRISYLTKGIAWAPNYWLDLTDPAKLSLRQSAVIRNELMDLEGADLQLISGYPNIQFATVDSPLMPQATLAAFFTQVNLASTGAAGGERGNIMSQSVYSNLANTSAPPPLPDVAEKGNASDDVHFESIGQRSLRQGDALSLDIASGEAAYERVVEWKVPDPRDEHGRYHPGGSPPTNNVWDAVKFTNPFKFPMTTAVATIVEGGKFRGQSQSHWVNPGQVTCLQITKALSIRTQSSEVEEEGNREVVWVGGRDYQRTTVKGTLVVKNNRGKETTMVITAEFSGELIEAEGNPDQTLRVEGASSINPRRHLEWTVKLAPGEEKSLTYRYRLLVDQ